MRKEGDRGNLGEKRESQWGESNQAINQTNKDPTQRANIKGRKGKSTNNTQGDPHKDNS